MLQNLISSNKSVKLQVFVYVIFWQVAECKTNCSRPLRKRRRRASLHFSTLKDSDMENMRSQLALYCKDYRMYKRLSCQGDHLVSVSEVISEFAKKNPT